MKTNGTNGSGNGRDPDGKKKVVKFPTLAERDRMRRKEREEEERWRKQYKKQSRTQSKMNNEPFLKVGNIPPFTRILVVALLAVHLPLYLLFNSGTQLAAFYNFGFIPGRFTGSFEWHWAALLSPFSHALIHGSWMHLLFNAIMGLALGTYFEKTYGTRTASRFFILCVLAGAAIHFALSPFSIVPVIGASGGISGLFGAMIYASIVQNTNHPLTQRFGKRGPWPMLIFWGLFIVVPGLLMGGGSVAWQAHLGGYIGGITLIIAIQKGKIRL